MPKFTSEVPTKVGSYLAYGDPIYKPSDPYYRPRWGLVQIQISGNNRTIYLGYNLVLAPNTSKYGLLKFCPIEDVADVPSMED